MNSGSQQRQSCSRDASALKACAHAHEKPPQQCIKKCDFGQKQNMNLRETNGECRRDGARWCSYARTGRAVSEVQAGECLHTLLQNDGPPTIDQVIVSVKLLLTLALTVVDPTNRAWIVCVPTLSGIAAAFTASVTLPLTIEPLPR